MAIRVTCPACGSVQQAGLRVGGFRCKRCQRDIWSIACHKCKTPSTFWGSATGAGALVFRCGNCNARNEVAKQSLRAISAEARRVARAEAAEKLALAQREKVAKAQHVQERSALVVHENAGLAQTLTSLGSCLANSLDTTTRFSFASLKIAAPEPAFVEPPAPEEPAPHLETFMPPALHGMSALRPSAKRKHQGEVAKAEAAFARAKADYEANQQAWRHAVTVARAQHGARLVEIRQTTARQHEDVDELERRFKEADPDAVVEYMTAALGALRLPYETSEKFRVAFSPPSKQLVVELELPAFEAVPDVREYRYVKARDEITSAPMPSTERKSLYASLVAQVALAALNAVFVADVHGTIESVVLNGHVHTLDKRTGQEVHPCLVTVRATRDRFGDLNLAQVDPAECLKGLQASISKSPSELLPVRPLVEFDMADPRFITEADVLSNLDERPNLMELTPKDFESLITNLFEKMGLETRLTQPSRDGGVDCVAYDSRPIFGGKVVIQAKRYKNTVGVSAVRDLFGTTQNEGATKGILVTTSGYGQASHEFANGKPLELIDGPGLLFLLHEYAGIEAKIEVPDDWGDPVAPS